MKIQRSWLEIRKDSKMATAEHQAECSEHRILCDCSGHMSRRPRQEGWRAEECCHCLAGGHR